MNILVTGGTGYIGSHTVLELLQAGYQVIILDNLYNSSPIVLKKITQLTGLSPLLIEGDIRDNLLLAQIFNKYKVDSVLHFAGLKSVTESIEHPIDYYTNNVGGSIALIEAMINAGVWKLVFSSSATVYGEPTHMPINENCPISKSTNPYGRSKIIIEDILKDLVNTRNPWSIAILRYFNPAGAHNSGELGEDPRSGTPKNLLPCIQQVALGKTQSLAIYGADYPTRDGTCIRDYLHVMDLACGHLKALKFIHDHSGVHVWNLGTGIGYTVLEMVKTFEKVIGKSIPFTITERRTGDIAECWADPTKATNELGWTTQRGLWEMIKDCWRWQSMHPNGYEESL